MIEKLVEQIESRFAELSQQMSDPEVIADRGATPRSVAPTARLEPANELAQEWRKRADDAAGAREMLAEGEDPELRELLDSSDASGSTSSRRRSGSRWSSRTRTTTRT